jgi:hypothetical protein
MAAEVEQPEPRRLRPAARLPWAAALAGIVVALTCWAVVATASSGRAAKIGLVRIVFTGHGGGRYLDTTRWLREDTRECYARRIANETLSLTWRITWTAPLLRSTGGFTLGAPTSRDARVTAFVRGTQVRDSCDSVEEEPGWNGSARCNSDLPVVAAASFAPTRRSDRTILSLRAPRFGSPDRPCELDIRNDQLFAHALLPTNTLTRAADGKTLTLPIGSNHPGPGDAYQRQRTCSLFPHIYEGVVYLYDCRDVLVWNGTLTVVPA